jgi:hypothetical protein
MQAVTDPRQHTCCASLLTPANNRRTNYKELLNKQTINVFFWGLQACVLPCSEAVVSLQHSCENNVSNFRLLFCRYVKAVESLLGIASGLRREEASAGALTALTGVCSWTGGHA